MRRDFEEYGVSDKALRELVRRADDMGLILVQRKLLLPPLSRYLGDIYGVNVYEDPTVKVPTLVGYGKKLVHIPMRLGEEE